MSDSFVHFFSPSAFFIFSLSAKLILEQIYFSYKGSDQMTILKGAFKETFTAILPVVIIVLLISLFLVDVKASMMWSFLIGALMILIGLTLFLYGIETGMEPIGKSFAEYVAIKDSSLVIAFISFIIGFSVTVAEPDLLILGQQIEMVTGGILEAGIVVFSVSIGVGIMIAFGVTRLLKNILINYFFLFFYAIIFIFANFADTQTTAMAFDASGATTGALTTPFVLVLSASIAAKFGGDKTEENSFGLVGAMSIGPIMAVYLLVLLTNSEIQGVLETYEYTDAIFGPIFEAAIPIMLESVFALLPIIVLFLLMNFMVFKLPITTLKEIFIGFLFTIIGLGLFLLGVNEGFMDMGHFLGSEIAKMGNFWLILIGLILGFVVVLAEPAVQVLGDQVKEVSNNEIKKPALLLSLSIGVGLAVSFSMLRIIYPGFEVGHILLPGFIIAILLSFYSPPIFTGIAFDAGGVASGPMAVTFILAFAQGAASYLPQAEPLDAFGVIAFIAMTPVIMVELLGSQYKFRHRKDQKA